MKILIVEDEEVLVKVLGEKFENEKFQVSIALDGEEAIAIAKKIKPDVILLDIILPKMDGLEVLASIKADEDLKDIPIIIMSNLGEDEKIKRALTLGATDYMVKVQHPINEIVDRVKELLYKVK